MKAPSRPSNLFQRWFVGASLLGFMMFIVFLPRCSDVRLDFERVPLLDVASSFLVACRSQKSQFHGTLSVVF